MSSTHEVSSQKKTKRYIRKKSRFIERNHLERGGHLDEFETTENTARRPGSVTLEKWMYMSLIRFDLSANTRDRPKTDKRMRPSETRHVKRHTVDFDHHRSIPRKVTLILEKKEIEEVKFFNSRLLRESTD